MPDRRWAAPLAAGAETERDRTVAATRRSWLREGCVFALRLRLAACNSRIFTNATIKGYRSAILLNQVGFHVNGQVNVLRLLPET